MPNYRDIAELILVEVRQRISSIINKKHLLLKHITEYEEQEVESIYIEDEDTYTTCLISTMIIKVDDNLRLEWYKEIMPELLEYDKLLFKNKTEVFPKYCMAETLALFISKMEVGKNPKWLFADTKSRLDFITLVTSPNLTKSEISLLKIRFGTDNNKVLAYILRELENSELFKINFAGIECLGCFITKSGSAFKRKNFDIELSKFKMSLNTSDINNELVTEITENIFKLSQFLKTKIIPS